jgi:hypothetical protein
MKVMSKSKEFIAIKVTQDIEFFINLGKYLSEKFLKIDTSKYGEKIIKLIVDER